MLRLCYLKLKFVGSSPSVERNLGSDNSQEIMLIMVYSISCWIFNIYKYSCRNIYTQFYKYSTDYSLCDSRFYPFSPSNLHQIWNPGTVLEYARPKDSETTPDYWIWWRFGWLIEG